MIKGKANIFTSNLNSDEIYSALGSRLGSRICNASINIELHGADKRILMQRSIIYEEERYDGTISNIKQSIGN